MNLRTATAAFLSTVVAASVVAGCGSAATNGQPKNAKLYTLQIGLAMFKSTSDVQWQYLWRHRSW